MTVTLQKWGNSQGIRLPKKFLDDLDIKENATFSLSEIDGNLMLRKINKHKTIKERLETFYNKTLSKIEPSIQEEIDTGAAVGDEIW